MKTPTLVLLFGCFSAIVLHSNARTFSDESSDTIASDSPSQVSFQYCSAEVGTNSHASCLASIFRFTANVAHIDTNCVESTEITLSNLQWKVKLCKRQVSINNITDVVDVFLQSSSNDLSTEWSCDAQAIFKLFPVGSYDRILVRKLAKRTYKNTNSIDGIKELMSWDDFVTNYVNDNEVKFEIEISTNGVNNNKPSNVNQTYARLHLLLENVTNLQDYNSTQVIVQGIKWKVHVQKKDYSLAVYLEADEPYFKMGSSYNVTADFKLLSFDITKNSLNKNFTHNYRWGSSQHGFDSYLYWDDFVSESNKYVVQDKAHLLVQFFVENPKSLWDVEGNDIAKAEETLPCSVCRKQFGSGVILSHSKCGRLFCQGCIDKLPQKVCPGCNAVMYANDNHPIFFGDKQQ